jgi:hypothetical protein
MDKAAITALADKYDTDILGYFGDIQRPEDDWLYTSLGKRRKRKNVLLVLTTRGGDPHVAYRISRALQDLYNTRPAASPTPGKKKVAAQGKFTVMVLSKCKSAGTIIALGASNVWMSKSAELGPIDVQLRKPDEVGERTSGLTPMQAMSVLENQSLSILGSLLSCLMRSVTFISKRTKPTFTGCAMSCRHPRPPTMRPMAQHRRTPPSNQLLSPTLTPR